jgi:hypothetical protein
MLRSGVVQFDFLPACLLNFCACAVIFGNTTGGFVVKTGVSA